MSVELLLLGARVNADQATRASVCRLARRGPDWERLVGTAGQHGTSGLLYACLQTACPDRVPVGVLRRLGELHRRWAGRVLALTAELLELLREFSQEGIPVLPLKGPLYAFTLYPHPALRPFNDLDLMVPPSQMRRAGELLVRRGYQPYFPLASRQQAAAEAYGSQGLFLRPGGEWTVDLHWRLGSPYCTHPFSFQVLWERSRQVSLGGHLVRAPSEQDQFLLACLHGAEHGWERLSWLVDVAQMVDAGRHWDWPAVLARADALRMRRRLLAAVQLAADMVGLRLPGPLADALQAEPETRLLAARHRHRLMDGLWATQPVSRPGLLQPFLLSAFDRPSDRLAYLLRLLFVPSWQDWASAPLPTSMLTLYPLLRPVRLLAKHSLALARARPVGPGRTG